MELRNYQKEAVVKILENKQFILADEMGLGKTGVVCVALKELNLKTACIFCPATLCKNWVKELKLFSNLESVIVTTSEEISNDKINIIAYSSLVGSGTRAKKLVQAIQQRENEAIVCDEAHYLKNNTSQRAKILLGTYTNYHQLKTNGIVHNAERVILLSGTPIDSRPLEFLLLANTVGMLEEMESLKYKSKFTDYSSKYKFTFCGPQKNSYTGGYEFKGASNLCKLNDELKISPKYLRRLKTDVLQELPEKVRQLIVLPSDNKKSIISEKQLPKTFEEVYKLTSSKKYFSEIAAERVRLAEEKIPYVKEFCDDVLENTDKIIIFAHHRILLDALSEYYGEKAITITGETKMQDRNNLVNEFQNNSNVKVAVLSIKAAGVGLTLTAATTVVMAETTWSPSDCVQSEDRCHRLGQKQSVTIYYLVQDGTLDAYVVQLMCGKMFNNYIALDIEL